MPADENSDSSDADVFEAQGAQAAGIQKILGIDDHRLLQQMLDAVEVKGAEFRPAGTNDQSVGSLRDSVGGIAVANRGVQQALGFRNRHRVVGANMGAFGHEG